MLRCVVLRSGVLRCMLLRCPLRCGGVRSEEESNP